MRLADQIVRLAKLTESPAPVVSVYLNTRWSDEHQRERTRAFLKDEIRKARQAPPAEGLATALDWVEARAEALIGQEQHPEAQGVALFSAPARGLGEVIPVRTPFEPAFVVATSPFLRPLAAVLEETPAALVVFVDTGSARLIPVATAGSGDEVRLESDVPGHHRRGGWAQLAQSRYQRHILERRGQHFEAVAETLGRMVDEHGVERIVVAGSVETVAAFQRSLSPGVAARVAGSVRGSRHEPASELVARAVEVIERVAAHEAAGVLDTLLTQAAKGGQAVAGLEAALEAVQRGAVDHLFLLRGFREPGGACAGCGALQPGEAATCRLCGHAVVATELGDAMVGRTIASGGGVTVVDTHPDLARAGRVAAWLRFAL